MGKKIDITEWERLAHLAHFHAGELAILAGVSQRHLHRTILREFGCSPRDWVSKMRFQSAQRLLLAGGHVKGVAQSASFNHCSSFCRWFRNQKERNGEATIRV